MVFRSAPPVTTSAFESPARLFLSANAQAMQAQAARQALVSRAVQNQFEAQQQASAMQRLTMKDAQDRAAAERIFGAQQQQNAIRNQQSQARIDLGRQQEQRIAQGQEFSQQQVLQERAGQQAFTNTLMGLPQATGGSLDDSLFPDSAGNVDPAGLFNGLASEISNSPLNGFVPADGERYGITTGSPEEWARFMTGLGHMESSFNTNTVGDVGRFRGNSNGLFQLSPDDALNHRLQDTPFTQEQLTDPATNARAAVAIMSNLVTRDGVISENQRGAARYWGPLRRNMNPSQRFDELGVLPVEQAEAEAAAAARRAAMVGRVAPRNAGGAQAVLLAEQQAAQAQARAAELANQERIAEEQEDRREQEERARQAAEDRAFDRERALKTDARAEQAEARAQTRFDERNRPDPRNITDSMTGSIGELVSDLDDTREPFNGERPPAQAARTQLAAIGGQRLDLKENIRRALITSGKRPTEVLPGLFTQPSDDELVQENIAPPSIEPPTSQEQPAPRPATGFGGLQQRGAGLGF